MRFPIQATFTFTVTQDGESGLWVVVSDDLCVVTEAPTHETLVDRVWLIASEMTLKNGLSIPQTHLRLLFQHESMHLAVAL